MYESEKSVMSDRPSATPWTAAFQAPPWGAIAFSESHTLDTSNSNSLWFPGL